jgi:hypothetical protein
MPRASDNTRKRGSQLQRGRRLAKLVRLEELLRNLLSGCGARYVAAQPYFGLGIWASELFASLATT